MKKYIKIMFRGKEIPMIHLSLEKWESIINDPKTLVAFTLDSEDQWTGRVLNKSEVVWAEYDEEYTKKENEDKFVLYRRKSDNVIVKLLVGQILDNPDNYELV